MYNIDNIEKKEVETTYIIEEYIYLIMIFII